MRTELIKQLEYAKLSIERALLQEKGQMEKLGKWYITQNITEAERALNNALRIVEEGGQYKLF